MRTVVFAAAILFGICSTTYGVDSLDLWPTNPPSWNAPSEPESDSSKPDSRKIADRHVIRLSNVSVPQLKIYPCPEKSPVTVVICPGGGYSILAWDLEGTEIAEWFSSHGVNAVVLKYRVPTRGEPTKWLAPVQDIQRAISLVRGNAIPSIASSRVGILGFSAGGNACAHAALATKRHYDSVDEFDSQSFRPDFAALIYAAYLREIDGKKRDKSENHDQDSKGTKDSLDAIDPFQLAKGLVVDENSPPIFFAHAFDDRINCMGCVALFAKLKEFDIPSALHIFSDGGHGFGGRRVDKQIDAWLELCQVWIKDNGWMDSTE